MKLNQLSKIINIINVSIIIYSVLLNIEYLIQINRLILKYSNYITLFIRKVIILNKYVTFMIFVLMSI